MKTWILAGVIALAATGSFFAASNGAKAGGLEPAKITDVNLGEIKGQLRLTADQEPLWAQVEEVLRSIAREQAEGESQGLLRRIGHRVVSIAFDGTVGQRIKSAAMPLLASLSDEQKATVRRIAQRFGIVDMAAAAN